MRQTAMGGGALISRLRTRDPLCALREFKADKDRTSRYLTGGERKPNQALEAAELAAYAAVASLILNLDESISKS